MKHQYAIMRLIKFSSCLIVIFLFDDMFIVVLSGMAIEDVVAAKLVYDKYMQRQALLFPM